MIDMIRRTTYNPSVHCKTVCAAFQASSKVIIAMPIEMQMRQVSLGLKSLAAQQT